MEKPRPKTTIKKTGKVPIRIIPQKNLNKMIRIVPFQKEIPPLQPFQKKIPVLQQKQNITIVPQVNRVLPQSEKPSTSSKVSYQVKLIEEKLPTHSEKVPQKPFFDLGNGEWVCSLCYYFTGIKDRLLDHQTREHYELLKDNDEFLQEKAKAWFCIPCNLQFSSNDTHRTHMKRLHPVALQEQDTVYQKLAPKYLCDLCEKVYYDKESFRRHNTILHLFTKRTVIDCLQKRTCRCELCSNICDSPESLGEHLKEEHPKNIIFVSKRKAIIKNYVCTVCWIEQSSNEKICDHLRQEHSLNEENLHSFYRLLCKFCAESFDTETQLAEHHKIKHLRKHKKKLSIKTDRSISKDTDQSLMCDLCGRVFSQRSNMLGHRERHVLPEHWTKYQAKLEECRVTINGEINWQCQKCPRVHEKAEDFVRHLVLHDQPKSFVCHECGFQTTRELLLKRHIKTVHLKSRDFKCEFCDLAFGTKRTLEDHRRRHTGERPWVCKICKKTFPNATCLYKHKQSHTDYFPFVCDWPGCDTKTRTRGRLEIHKRVHTGQKPYACSICPKAFKRSGDLKKHETVHTDSRPCVCDLCGRAYKHRKYLAYHKKSAHNYPFNSDTLKES